MSDKHYVDLDITSSSNNGKYKPVSRVTLWLDDENCLTAGDDTGFELVADCPYATQEMVNALLAKFKGYEYQAYEAEAATIDPAAELGDGVYVDGMYSVIAQISDDGEGYPSLSAPGKAELEDEYPADGPLIQIFNRKFAETNSKIEKTAGEIKIEVSKKTSEDDVTSLISTAVGKIELSVSSENGTTSFTLTQDGAEISAKELQISVDLANVTGKLKAAYIDATDLHVNAANIDGQLTIGKLPDEAATKKYVDDAQIDMAKTIGQAGFQTETGVTKIINGTVTTDYVNALQISAKYLKGRYVYLKDAADNVGGEISITGATTANSAIDLKSYGALRLTAQMGDVYAVNGSNQYLHLYSGDGSVIAGNGNFRPNASNMYFCGTPAHSWADVYVRGQSLVAMLQSLGVAL